MQERAGQIQNGPPAIRDTTTHTHGKKYIIPLLLSSLSPSPAAESERAGHDNKDSDWLPWQGLTTKAAAYPLPSCLSSLVNWRGAASSCHIRCQSWFNPLCSKRKKNLP